MKFGILQVGYLEKNIFYKGFATIQNFLAFHAGEEISRVNTADRNFPKFKLQILIPKIRQLQNASSHRPDKKDYKMKK